MAARTRLQPAPLGLSAYPGATTFEKLVAFVTAKRRDLTTPRARMTEATRLHALNPNVLSRKT